MTDRAANIAHPHIWLVLALALSLRAMLPILGYCYTRDATIFDTPDTASYLAPARELIAHHRFFANGAPEIIRTPGYPLLLAAGLLLGRLEITTIACQILLSCLTVFMVYWTAYLLFGRERIALIAAVLYAIEPLSVLFTSLLASETLFTTTVMVGVYYLVRYLRRQSLADLLLSAGALAASAYVRPIAYFLPVAVAAGLAVWCLVNARAIRRRVLTHTGAFLIVSVGLIGLWQVRNEIETGYSGFSAVASDNMYFILAGSVLAAQQHVPYYGMRNRLGYQDQQIYFQQHPDQRTWSVARRINYMNRTADHILLGGSSTYARIYFEGIVRATFDPGSTEFIRFFDVYPKRGGLLTVQVDQGTIATVAALFASPLLFWTTLMMLPLQLMYLLGACVTLCGRAILDPAVLAVVFVAAYYMAIAGGPGDWGRFRLPAMPIICILAGPGLSLMTRRREPRVVA